MTITDEDRELFIVIDGIRPDSETAQRVRAGLAFTWEVEQAAHHREAAEARIVAWLRTQQRVWAYEDEDEWIKRMADAIEGKEHLT